jgi:hypothetical protein
MARPIQHDGSVFRRKGTKFLWMHYRERDGTRRRESTFTEDRDEANRKLRERLQGQRRQHIAGRAKGRKLYLRGVGGLVFGQSLQPPFRQPKTHAANVRATNHLKGAFATRQLIDVTQMRSSTIFVIGFVSPSVSKHPRATLNEEN